MDVLNQAPFLDAAGEPQLRRSIAAFIDVLGFSALCSQETERGKSQDLLRRVAQAIGSARIRTREALSQDDSDALKACAVKFFSDNVVFGLACDTERELARASTAVIRLLQNYQLAMSLNGFFVRGGVTLGLLCVTEDIVFGNALIDSYQLESKTSIVPRVVVSPSLFQALGRSNSDLEKSDALCRDVDRWWFVNYLQAAADPQAMDWAALASHKQRVLQALESTHRHDVLPKFGWLVRYHNMFCYWHRDKPGYSPDYHIDRKDEESVILRWSELQGME